MKIGYSIFGKEYEIMLKNDLHDIQSIDHYFLKTMILLDEESSSHLYCHKPTITNNITRHELYEFSMQFKRSCSLDTIKEVTAFTTSIAKSFNVEFDDMIFGGTEKQIIERGTDWCADISRVGAVLLQCLGIPSRIIHLVNKQKAYNGHVVVEAFYENKFGIVDFLYGYIFYDQVPLSALDAMDNNDKIQKLFDLDINNDYSNLFFSIAINEYDSMDKNNNYNLSKPNEYCSKIIHESKNDGTWIMNEDKILSD